MNKRGLFARAFDWISFKAISAAATYLSLVPNQPIWTNWTIRRAIDDGYKATPWVYVCTRRIARAVAAVPWKVRVRRLGGEWQDSPGHPIEQLLEAPGPGLTRPRLFNMITHHCLLGGNSLLYKVRASSRRGREAVVGFQVMSPDALKPIVDALDLVEHYRYQTFNSWPQVDSQQDIPAKDLIHFMIEDPANPYWGLSPLQAIGKVVDAEVEALRWWKVSLQNRMIKDGLLSFKGRNLSTRQWEEARSSLARQAGSDTARGPLVVGAEATYTPFSMTPAEFDFIESRKMTRTDICAAFGVPPIVVGIHDFATYNNYREALRSFWADTVVPTLEDFKGVLNLGLVPEFGDPRLLQVEFDLSDVDALKRDLKERLEMATILFGMSVPFNRIDEYLELGLGAIEGGDVGYLPSSLLPATERTDDEPDDEEPLLSSDLMPVLNDGSEEKLKREFVEFLRQRGHVLKAHGQNGGLRSFQPFRF